MRIRSRQLRIPATRRGFLSRFLTARDGSAAVEFAMVALPFFAMMFAIIELGIIFMTASVLENATVQTGRLVRTGQASAQSMTPEQFESQFCSRMSVFASDCASRAHIDVRVVPVFAQAPADPLVGGVIDPNALGFCPGGPGNLVVVRVWYEHPLLTTFLAQAMPRMQNGSAVLTATTAFRNEPFAPVVGAPC